MSKAIDLYAFLAAIIMCLPAELAKRTKKAVLRQVAKFDLGKFDWMLVIASLTLAYLWIDFVIKMESIR